MSLDDDIMMPCSDLERGFATWRKAPQTMVGFYPRLIEGTPLEFRGERWVGSAGSVGCHEAVQALPCVCVDALHRCGASGIRVPSLLPFGSA
jgi:hypothetical protein